MNVTELVDKCLIDKDAIETHPWTQKEYQDIIIMRHKTNNKWFGAIFHLENELCINLKCPPDIIPILKEQYPAVKPAWHMNKKHWCTIYVNQISKDVLEQLIKMSFDITAPKRKQN